MFSKTRLPKLIGLHLRSVLSEWLAQKICSWRIFAFADLSGPMLSGNSHQARGGPCGELTSATGRLRGTAGKRLEFLILGKARRLTGNSAAMIRGFYRIPADCYSVVHVARQQFSCGLSSEEFLDGLSIKSQNSPRRTSHHTSIAL